MEGILEGAMEKANYGKLKEILLDGKRSASVLLEEQNKEQSPSSTRTRTTTTTIRTTTSRSQNEPADKRQKGDPLNRYSGWTVPSNSHILETVDIDTITPESFYRDYVRLRKPVVIRGSLQKVADAPNLDNWKSVDYLRTKAGDSTVVVEQRSSEKDSFGKGNEKSMAFGELLELIAKGDAMHYLTTQDVEANEDGRPDLMAPFMKRFQDDFPLRPILMGNLVPQNINVWMGNNSDGASSGLHHDYHDNLYLVLKGKKRFRLFSPMDTEKMYTRGKLLQVHENGRINYEGDETTAYGADLKSDAAATAAMRKESAESMLAQAELDVENGVDGAQERLEAAESAMDDALEALLDAEADDEDDDEDEDGGTLFSSQGAKFDDNDNNDYGDDDDDDENDGQEEDEPEQNDSKPSSTASSRRLVDRTVKNPDNFSRVPFDILDDKKELDKSFPDMLNAKAAFCTVEEGECLYLPASWFHEVRSFGGKGGHLAMNYWFHPPDAADNFEKPYTTNFWPNDFEQRFDSQ
ncbi:unnamed protein product [Cylindrotheca closterium]|uniref:JmjC domain-containing protein n=1 Tax=Cylindrotheca closterium TaxID=2856 RepID=A0AAD2FY19_9STRA|nr:unnamed protein product [Cylindrotheca closterium]